MVIQVTLSSYFSLYITWPSRIWLQAEPTLKSSYIVKKTSYLDKLFLDII